MVVVAQAEFLSSPAPALTASSSSSSSCPAPIEVGHKSHRRPYLSLDLYAAYYCIFCLYLRFRLSPFADHLYNHHHLLVKCGGHHFTIKANQIYTKSHQVGQLNDNCLATEWKLYRKYLNLWSRSFKLNWSIRILVLKLELLSDITMLTSPVIGDDIVKPSYCHIDCRPGNRMMQRVEDL